MRVKARPSSRPRIGGRSGRSDCSALRARLIQQETCTDYVNPYYGFVNITLSLDDDLVKKVRKIAVERDTTLTGMVRDYLEGLATEAASSGRRPRTISSTLMPVVARSLPVSTSALMRSAAGLPRR